MDHSGMDHGGHGDMDMGPKCSMNMLFTWSSENLCIVFRQWHVTGTFSLIVSLFAIVLLAAGYEAIREVSRRYEQSHEARMSAFSSGSSRRDSKATAERKGVIIKGALYAVQVFYSFFIMLLFMTYNGWVMLAVAVGAFVGYITFGRNLSSAKSVACH
ncbi:hypothetical protein, variant 1 [Exophiala mesophila]|uniref:Copper transport protein n=1 Tax=Exophiala mesophila TaxID=212818 RepID=A0A0D1XP07_EXOME|nr:hypothetical protein, variant 1 [Exophiala mesophila]KIV89841.1 hypothetical protein, variant 1 [Exophiala mesophila]